MGELRGVKRPACSERQTGACRSYGVAVRQPYRGHEEPVEATDPSATGRRTPTDQVRTRRRERSVPESNGESDHSQPPDWFPTEGAINPGRQAGVQRKKRSTPIAERVSSGRRTNVKLQPPDWTEDEGLSQLRRFDPCCLRRTNVKLRFGSIPSWETGGERIILQTDPCNRDHAPRFLWSETLEKAKQ